MQILIYEDSGYKDLYPLNLLRASYDILCGANTILQRIECTLNNKYEVSLHCRNILSAHLKEVHKNKINRITNDDHLLLNGRVIFSEDSLKYLLSKKEKNNYYIFKNEIIAAYIAKDKSSVLKELVENKNDENVFHNEFFIKHKLKCIKLKDDFDIRVIKYSWDAVDLMIQGGLEDDLTNYFIGKKKFQRMKDKDNFINHKRIFTGKNVKIYPDVVLDASAGTIIIDDNSVIEPFTFIKGPAYIGKNCLLKSGTKIYGPCVIGDDSKVAGEIVRSIFHSSVNKQHDGFVGNSYICPFVNLGADTVTSNLKNNYSNIRIKLNGEEVNTGMKFIGSMIGDHSKTAINTMLNTGSVIGIFANIYGGGFPDKEINSFSWSETGKAPLKYDIDKAIETAKIVFERRGLKMNEAYKDLVKELGIKN